jgi:hypothetical protein
VVLRGAKRQLAVDWRLTTQPNSHEQARTQVKARSPQALTPQHSDALFATQHNGAKLVKFGPLLTCGLTVDSVLAHHSSQQKRPTCSIARQLEAPTARGKSPGGADIRNMTPSSILDSAREDTSSSFRGSIGLAILCAIVLAFNWKYVYNFAAGPFPFDSVEASFPNRPITREFVRAEGPLLSTGWAQETTVRLLRGLIETKDTSAHFLAMRLDGRLLIVKVPADFSGETVEGRLVRLPAAIQASLGKQAAYPWMVDAETGYRWDFNLFVVIAAPLMVIAILMALTFGWRSADVWRHPAIAPLKRFGDPRQIVGSIDREIRDAGKPGSVGLLIVTASWVIVTKPYLLIFAASDLMGVGLQLTPGKSGGNTPPRPTVRVWRRGQVKPDRIDIRDPEVARAALEKICACAPWAAVADTAAFERQWDQDRAACERDADVRRQSISRGVTLPKPA